METFKAQTVAVVGDTHSLKFEYLLRQYKLKDFILIHVGDCGAGFEHEMVEVRYLDKIQKYCEANNGQVFICRGNHDKPSCWDLTHNYNKLFSRIEFVPDYTYKIINDKTFLFVGGAISIDRKFRVEGKSYWKDEVFVLREDYKTLPPCDVLITHTAGDHQYPYGGLAKLADFFIKDVHLESELLDERKLVKELYYQVQPRVAHLYGHFHSPHSEYVNNTLWRCLKIDEVADITNHIR